MMNFFFVLYCKGPKYTLQNWEFVDFSKARAGEGVIGVFRSPMVKERVL